MDLQETESISSYLSFKIGDELFAAHVSKVLSIIEVQKLTKMPNTPPFVLGVINLRGSVLPIIDTHIKLGIPSGKKKKNPIIIVLEVENKGKTINIGGLVDGVREVKDIDVRDIIDPPEIGGKFKSEFITGMIQEDAKFIMILDVDKIFSTEFVVPLLNPDYQQAEFAETKEVVSKEEEEAWLQEALDDSKQIIEKENIQHEEAVEEEVIEPEVIEVEEVEAEEMAGEIENVDAVEMEEAPEEELAEKESGEEQEVAVEVDEKAEEDEALSAQIEATAIKEATEVQKTEEKVTTEEKEEIKAINEVEEEPIDETEDVEVMKKNETEEVENDETHSEITVDQSEQLSDDKETHEEESLEEKEKEEGLSAADKLLKKINSKKNNDNEEQAKSKDEAN